MKLNVMPRLLIAAAAVALVAPTALAAEFVMSPKHGGLHRVQFESDAPFESITGVSNHVEGSVTLDLAKPSTAKGQLKVKVDTLKTGIAQRDEHLAGKDWLDAANHPHIIFTFDGADVKDVQLADGVSTRGKVKGKLTVKGVTKEVTAALQVAYLAATEKTKKAWITNDALRVKALFKIKLSDYGVKVPEHIAGIKVADEVEIKASLTPILK